MAMVYFMTWTFWKVSDFSTSMTTSFFQPTTNQHKIFSIFTTLSELSPAHPQRTIQKKSKGKLNSRLRDSLIDNKFMISCFLLFVRTIFASLLCLHGTAKRELGSYYFMARNNHLSGMFRCNFHVNPFCEFCIFAMQKSEKSRAQYHKN